MELKEIEGVRIKPGETLVIIAPSMFSAQQLEWLHAEASKHGISIIVLPPNTKVYIKNSDSDQT